MNKRSLLSKKIVSLTLLMGIAGMSKAQTLSDTGAFMNFGIMELLWTITLIMGAVLLFLVFVMLRIMMELKREQSGIPREERLSLWERLLSLRPLAEEKQLTMDHKYDGIEELDNPTPPWFNFLFYGSIVFAIVYMVKYHVIGDGKVMENEYQAELKEWESKSVANRAAETDLIDESNVTLVTDTGMLTAAADIFKTKCVACHGEKGEGKNGPNLTDTYWINGGEIRDIFRTINQGVPEKGMISWKGLLKPGEIQNMASYILSIEGTVPEGAGKEPEGTKKTAAPSQETLPADSTIKTSAYMSGN